MGIRNYWVDKDELEAKAVQVIRDYLDECVTIKAMFSSNQKLQDSIMAEVIGNVKHYNSMYRLMYNVDLKVDIVIADLGQGSQKYHVVKAFDNVSVEIQ